MTKSIGSESLLEQVGLFESVWPHTTQFPHNRARTSVAGVVHEDLLGSQEPLLITSYTSLDRIIAFLGRMFVRWEGDPEAYRRVRILLGHEPSVATAEAYLLGPSALSQEIKDYWIERGISVVLCAKLIAGLELLQRAEVEVRTSGERVVHAKIYRGDHAITLGSSNFSRAGMQSNAEANVRFESREGTRFYDAAALAEAIWDEGREYKTDLIELLRKLLQPATWQEALARACAELLDGEWAKTYASLRPIGEMTPLWPAQEQGIAQAMWVLEHVGSVLVADATGSGKTKMGARLIRAIQMRNVRTGRIRQDMPVMVSPPRVELAWRNEAVRCGLSLETISQGELSDRRSGAHDTAREAVRRAQVLAVDEAHNFLNRYSARTQRLYANLADHVLLFTATPINRGAQDLLAIIDLLGADNFEEDVLEIVSAIWKRRRHRRREGIGAQERAKIRQAIQRFTVRRTKSMFNALVDEEPERYRNLLGNPCRYPEHLPKSYMVDADSRDRGLASAIREEAAGLRGMLNIGRRLRVPPHLQWEGWSDQKYLEQRLRGASALAAYRVSSTLRSSRAALLEHLLGTQEAREICQLKDPVKRKDTGNIIGRLQELAGHPPRNELSCRLPEWLSDPDIHEEACLEEAKRYERIVALAKEISDSREDIKAYELERLLKKHDRVLAFDAHLITLSDIQQRLKRRGLERVILATGEQRNQEIHEAFKLDSTSEGVIGLCSDALSEGVNLQGASVVVLLDMPSVIRTIEQRIGRIDRMDSPHGQIEVYWPDDYPEFALRTDELLINRHRDVRDLLGSNVPLPGSMEPVNAGQILERVASGFTRSGEDLADAFVPVRSLVSGAGALVEDATYRKMLDVQATVISSVSVVESQDDWSFFAVAGTEWGAPRWVYFDSDGVETDLEGVSRRLRVRLGPDPSLLDINEQVADRLERDMLRLAKLEARLLPRRKQLALEQMKRVLRHYATRASDHDPERAKISQQILHLANRDVAADQESVNLSELTDWWLEVIRPRWYEHLGSRRRKGPARLKDITTRLREEPLDTAELLSIKNLDPRQLYARPLANRIVAAIIGVAA